MTQYTDISAINATATAAATLDPLQIADSMKNRLNHIEQACSRVPVEDILTGEILNEWDMTIYVGIDDHDQTYSVCGVNGATGLPYKTATFSANISNLLNYCSNLAKEHNKINPGIKIRFVLGYEAGCHGVSLALKLQGHGLNCVVIAPTSVRTSAQDRVAKTDPRDALGLARSLYSKDYQPVWIPDEIDRETKAYIRLYEDLKSDQKKLKQRINNFVAQLGYVYGEGKNKWTIAHLKWLRELPLTGLFKETLSEYLAEYDHREDILDRYTKRIEEIAQQDRYRDICHSITALKGIRTHSALLLVSEIGDFCRFSGPAAITNYVGIIPIERSSGKKQDNRYGITKQGNGHVRKAIIECVQGTVKGNPSKKSKDLKRRQAGLPAEVVEYADRANRRIKDKYTHMMESGKQRNVAITACARELLCFVWGIATGNIYGRDGKPAAASAA